MKSFLYSFWAKPAEAEVVSDTPPADRDPSHYFLRPDYEIRPKPKYFEDFVPGENHPSYQPDVYALGEALALIGKRRIIDIGCGKAERLKSLADRFDVVGVDFGKNIEYCKHNHAFGHWLEHDLEADAPFPFAPADVLDSIVICADVIEHLANPLPLLANLKKCADAGACVLLSTPERDLVRGRDHLGPPSNPAHVREWSIGELRALLLHVGFHVPFLGLTANDDLNRQMCTIVAILVTR
jgi:SAM-dependent methyltransferase